MKRYMIIAKLFTLKNPNFITFMTHLFLVTGLAPYYSNILLIVCDLNVYQLAEINHITDKMNTVCKN